MTCIALFLTRIFHHYTVNNIFVKNFGSQSFCFHKTMDLKIGKGKTSFKSVHLHCMRGTVWQKIRNESNIGTEFS